MNMKIKEETEMTMEEPKETNEAKVEIVADGKVIPLKKNGKNSELTSSSKVIISSWELRRVTATRE